MFGQAKKKEVLTPPEDWGSLAERLGGRLEGSHLRVRVDPWPVTLVRTAISAWFYPGSLWGGQRYTWIWAPVVNPNRLWFRILPKHFLNAVFQRSLPITNIPVTPSFDRRFLTATTQTDTVRAWLENPAIRDGFDQLPPNAIFGMIGHHDTLDSDFPDHVDFLLLQVKGPYPADQLAEGFSFFSESLRHFSQNGAIEIRDPFKEEWI